ncbi:hypothetical protein DYE48_18755 [Halobacillus trueperi]|uniref:Uncharacterized protein n=1 Tax=Halobacillus trueperi TaxID=156205 RepID=A0A3E0J0R6_9BACI|nr:hypothetical protein DYE48_18755 [Halobacillus trueperi]
MFITIGHYGGSFSAKACYGLLEKAKVSVRIYRRASKNPDQWESLRRELRKRKKWILDKERLSQRRPFFYATG